LRVGADKPVPALFGAITVVKELNFEHRDVNNAIAALVLAQKIVNNFNLHFIQRSSLVAG
jgi:hypothetical protein